MRARTPHVSKFRHVPVRLLRRRARAPLRAARARQRAARAPTTSRRSSAPPSTPGRTSGARGREQVYVGYSPIIVVDAATILGDLPAAHVLHVVRNPWSAYADTKKRPVPLSLERLHARLDAEPVPRAAAPRALSRTACTSCAPRTSWPIAQRALAPVCAALGVEAAPSRSRTPSWNGDAAHRGLSRGARSARRRRRRTARRRRALSAAERDEIRAARLAVPRGVRLRERSSSSARRVLVTGGGGLRRREPRAPPVARRRTTVHARGPARLGELAARRRSAAVSTIHAVDLADAAGVGALIGRVRPDWVFHLAAYGAYSWQTDLARMVQTNVDRHHAPGAGVSRAGVAAFVNTGSSSEYGFKDHAPSEREWLEPNSALRRHQGGGDALLPPRCANATASHCRRCASTRSTARGRNPNRLMPDARPAAGCAADSRRSSRRRSRATTSTSTT